MDDELGAVRARAEAIRDEQVATALARLEAHGEVTPEKRAEIERLADRLVDRLLAVPERTIDAAEDEDDVAAVLELFGD